MCPHKQHGGFIGQFPVKNKHKVLGFQWFFDVTMFPAQNFLVIYCENLHCRDFFVN